MSAKRPKANHTTSALTRDEHEDLAILKAAEERAARLLFFFGVRGNVNGSRCDVEWEEETLDFARDHCGLKEAERKLAKFDNDADFLSLFSDAIEAAADAGRLLGMAVGWRLALGGQMDRSIVAAFFSQSKGGAR